MTNKSYRKGYKAEQEVMEALRGHQFQPHRQYRSGVSWMGQGQDVGDIFALHETGGVLLIEVKSWRRRDNTIEVTPRDMEKLYNWEQRFAPLKKFNVPIRRALVLRFSRKRWAGIIPCYRKARSRKYHESISTRNGLNAMLSWVRRHPYKAFSRGGSVMGVDLCWFSEVEPQEMKPW